MKPHMVIHCASGINNSGDEAILSALIERYIDDFRITVISLNKANTLSCHQGIRCCSERDRRCRAVIKKCDVFILGGGGLLQDETTIYNVFRWLKYLQLAINYRKFTMLYANSIGPLNYSLSRLLVKKILKKVNLITLRDTVSKKFLLDMGMKENIYVTADPVFAINNDLSEDSFQKMKERYHFPDRYIGVFIRHWFDTVPFVPVNVCTRLGIRTHKNAKKYLRYIKKFAAIVDFCNEKNELPVVFVSCMTGRDEKVAEDIVSLCRSKKNIILNDKNLSWSNVMEIISHSDFVIGMRLHSIIYSIKCAVPVVILSYSKKVLGIAQDLGLKNVCMDVNNFSLQKFYKIVCTDEFKDMGIILRQVRERALKMELQNDILLKHYYKMFQDSRKGK